MEKLLIVMQIVALGTLTALSIYLIVVLSRLRESLASIEKDFKALSARAIPVFQNLEQITSSIKDVTSSIGAQVDTVRHSIESMKTMVENMLDFERRIQARIEEPVLDSISFFTGVVKGIRTFVDRMRG